MNLIEAIIIAIIEGLTDYLPISSTAHIGFFKFRFLSQISYRRTACIGFRVFI